MRHEILAAMLVAAAFPAAAQVPSQAALVAAFIRSPQVLTVVTSTLGRDEPAPLRARCGVPAIQSVSGVVIQQSPIFVREGAGMTFQSGALVVRLATLRCAEPAVRRVLLVRAPGSAQIITHALAPGDFSGNLKLEADTLRIVEPGVAAAAHCAVSTGILPLDTKAIVPMTAQGGAERWTFWACGKAYTADVSYTPILRGGVNAGMNVLGGDIRPVNNTL
jgi:hypothetical protein